MVHRAPLKHTDTYFDVSRRPRFIYKVRLQRGFKEIGKQARFNDVLVTQKARFKEIFIIFILNTERIQNLKKKKE